MVRTGWVLPQGGVLQIARPSLVFERNHGLIILAEGGHTGEAALRLGDVHDGTVAIDGVAVGREIPPPTFSGALDSGLHDRVGRRR